MRPFEIAKGFCLTVNLEADALEAKKKKTEYIMQEIDLYEVKNAAGNYVNRNEIENMYSKLEDSIARKFHRIISLLKSEEADVEFKKMIQTNEWFDKEAALLSHLILSLIRNPHLKYLIYDNEEIPNFMKPIFYRLMISNQGMAVKLAMDALYGEQLEFALHFLKTSSKNSIKTLTDHIMYNFQLRIYKTKGEQKFFLSDRPILVQEFENIDYAFPISPSICVGTTRLQMEKGILSTHSLIVYMSDDEVKKFNKKIIKNTKKMLIIQNDLDLKFVKKYRECT
ncbi:DUF4238 domain-containing protein [Bacillus cereus]